LVQPNIRIELAISAICSSLCVRGLLSREKLIDPTVLDSNVDVDVCGVRHCAVM
jgi:hypothetical protein